MVKQDKYKTLISQMMCPWLGQPFMNNVDVSVKGSELKLTFAYPVEKSFATSLDKMIRQTLGPNMLQGLKVKLDSQVPAYQTQLPLIKVNNVKNLIAISSGKGGVGKTTVACHLASCLSEAGYSVGLFDADIHGPNIPIMMQTEQEEAQATPANQFLPIVKNGIATMSLAYLIDPAKPMVWRGPILSKTLLQILMQTAWPKLDFLLLDLPPGTGDTQLTLAQKIPLVGAVSITTPHPMSVADAQKGIKMFEKVNVPMLGYINNMSSHTCSKCGHEEEIWGSLNQKISSTELTCLGSMPLHEKYTLLGDAIHSDEYVSAIVIDLVKEIIRLPKHPSGNIPTIVTE